MKPKTVPDGYGTVTPWIVTKDTAQLIDFITEAFGGEELARMFGESGAIEHAEVKIGDSVVLMFDSFYSDSTPALLRIFVDDADEAFERAITAGATSVTEVSPVLAWGDRVGRVRDPLGNIWWIQERVDEPTPQEMLNRMTEKKYIDSMKQVQVRYHVS